jgi:hypothetical protein
MFNFFRNPSLVISPGYWSEKLQATDTRGGHEEYSPDVFRRAVKEDFEAWELEGAEKDDAWKEIEEEVLSAAEDGEAAAIDAALRFSFSNGTYKFKDFWEYNLKEYTERYIWCCYAIVWGIEQYDKCRPQGLRGDENGDCIAIKKLKWKMSRLETRVKNTSCFATREKLSFCAMKIGDLIAGSQVTARDCPSSEVMLGGILHIAGQASTGKNRDGFEVWELPDSCLHRCGQGCRENCRPAKPKMEGLKS